MAKVKITGHASGSGVITVTAPNTSTDRTITLPDATATIATTAQLPTVSSTAPSSPAEGDQWFNSSTSTVSTIPTKSIAVYSGTAWESLGGKFSATGGTITTSGSYTIHTFTSSGTFTPSTSGTVDYLVVAGGGGGGGGGGGAGGLLTAAGFSVAETGLTVTIGAGNELQGSNSVFSTITAIGGGGRVSYQGNGMAGGSGSGCSSTGSTLTGGAGTAGQGNAGGGGAGNGGGGGGGAGAVGGELTSSAGGAGGVGLANSYSGSAVYYAGGGGGALNNSSGAGAGGNGGGGAGAQGSGVNGTANTGGGAGGGYQSGGGTGGSGIVIIRYLT